MAIDRERKNRVIDLLRKSSLDAFVCSSASDVLLLTGYWPVMNVSVAIFTSDGDVRVILPEDEVDLAEKTTEAALIPFKPAELDKLTNPVQALVDPLHLLTQKLGFAKANIAMPLQLDVQPASYAVSTIFRTSLIELLQRLQPNARYVACDAMLEEIKACKTPTELDLMQKAVKIAAAGFARAEETILAGLREVDVAARAQEAFERSPDAACLQRSYGFFFCMSGPNSASASAAYARTRQRRIEEGDLVMIHANTCADGYWTDITRTFSAGATSARQEEMRAAIREAREAALRSIHPGAAAREVDQAARTVMEAHGLGAAFRHATGHGVGFAAANGNALPRIHPHSPDTLETGMTFNIEPAAYFDQYGGMRHCDVVAVAPDGACVLTQF